jgi:hypothetical protein
MKRFRINQVLVFHGLQHGGVEILPAFGRYKSGRSCVEVPVFQTNRVTRTSYINVNHQFRYIGYLTRGLYNEHTFFARYIHSTRKISSKHLCIDLPS